LGNHPTTELAELPGNENDKVPSHKEKNYLDRQIPLVDGKRSKTQNTCDDPGGVTAECTSKVQ